MYVDWFTPNELLYYDDEIEEVEETGYTSENLAMIESLANGYTALGYRWRKINVFDCPYIVLTRLFDVMFDDYN